MAWTKEYTLRYQRERYKKVGRKKYPNICIVCNRTFLSVRKDRKFCSPKCISTGSNNGRWLGGKQRNLSGYITIFSPSHPYRNINNTVLEHRLVMEKHLKRFLNPKEVVHHINKNPSDNRIENLILFPTINKHSQYHWRTKKSK